MTVSVSQPMTKELKHKPILSEVEQLELKGYPISITKAEIAYKLGRKRFAHLYKRVFTDEVIKSIGAEDTDFLSFFKHKGTKKFWIHDPRDRKVFLFLSDYIKTNWA